jgi:4-carboxymuconolactone decarboxylase
MRFPPIPADRMTPEQRTLAASYAKGWRTTITNPDGSLGGPFDATLRSPDLAGRLAGVSNYFRDGTSLPRRLNEFAILLVAREWDSAFEWHAHCAAALEADLSRDVVDEAAVYEVVGELQVNHRLGDAGFERAKAVLGERQLIDLVAVCGYYTLVAMMLATADVHPPGPLPPGMPQLTQLTRQPVSDA